jgi:putative ABC transport system ATP-binding protein
MIELRNITYNNLFSIEQFKIKKNDRVLIKGASGKGKTTLLHLMAGFIKAYKGEIYLLGKELSHLSEKEVNDLRKNQLAFIFQKLNLLELLTPLENLKLVSRGPFNVQEALQLLSQLGLQDKAYLNAHKLSTGEQQRVACARAIFSRPEIIFADEPTSSLDDVNTQKVMELLMNTDHAHTMVVVSHDYRLEKYFSKVLQFEDIVTL